MLNICENDRKTALTWNNLSNIFLKYKVPLQWKIFILYKEKNDFNLFMANQSLPCE